LIVDVGVHVDVDVIDARSTDFVHDHVHENVHVHVNAPSENIFAP